MNFERLVAPLVAINDERKREITVGSGFLARINADLYLVTVAHLADEIVTPRADWTVWPDEIHLVNPDKPLDAQGRPTKINTYPLFIEGYNGKKVPRFKYALRTEPGYEGQVQDVMLLPLQDDDPIVKMYDVFDLPKDRATFAQGATVTMLGRRNPFPSLSTAEHTLTQDLGLIRFMDPLTQKGDSGGPVVTSTGLLLGMMIGEHLDVPGAMLMSTETIESVATSVRGAAKDWPGTTITTPTPTA
ncbi:hypothetical protein [Arthrobacter humicola]